MSIVKMKILRWMRRVNREDKIKNECIKDSVEGFLIVLKFKLN